MLSLIDQDSTDGTFTLTQAGLTQKGIDHTGLTDCNFNKIPASTTTLGSDKDGARCIDADEIFEYAVAVHSSIAHRRSRTVVVLFQSPSKIWIFRSTPQSIHSSYSKLVVRWLSLGLRFVHTYFDLLLDSFDSSQQRFVESTLKDVLRDLYSKR